jgi:hypothetical protein
MEAYTDQFIWKLNREYTHDEVCRRIAADKKLGPGCAQVLRTYVDPGVRRELDADRKARVGVYRARLVEAIGGLEAAAALYRHRDPEKAAFFQVEAAKLQPELQGADELLDVKKHGRFRDHGILYSARQIVEKALGEPVSYETLANLVNAADRALLNQDEDAMDEATADTQRKEVTANTLRVEMDNFLKRVPNWDTLK